jgi:hypothetical protein
MHKQWASRHGPSNYDFCEEEPTDSPEDCKREIRRDPANGLYAERGHMRAVTALRVVTVGARRRLSAMSYRALPCA